MTTLQIAIDGTEYATTDDDQEAAALLRLADRDPANYDLFLIDSHGVETFISDGQIVDLHDGARFRARRKIHFTVDSTRHSSYDDDQTAAALLRLAGRDPATFDLVRVGSGGDRHKFTDEELVVISNGNAFVSVEQVRALTVIVNTRPHQWQEPQISYQQVVELAYPGQPITDQNDVTVHYTYRHNHGGGTLTAGHSARVKEGMVFDVYRTTRS